MFFHRFVDFEDFQGIGVLDGAITFVTAGLRFRSLYPPLTFSTYQEALEPRFGPSPKRVCVRVTAWLAMALAKLIEGLMRVQGFRLELASRLC